ncbi:MAG: VanZ family protein [Ferruginibacter sp.]
MLHQLIKPLFFLVTGILLLWLLVRQLFGPNLRKKFSPLWKEIVIVLFLIYSGCVLFITMYPVPMTLIKTVGNGNINLVPFAYTFKGLTTMPPSTKEQLQVFYLQNIVGNIILFIPLGSLLPLVSRYKNLVNILIAATLSSAAIELSQFFLRFAGVYRLVDIDDVILNVSGAFIGFMLLVILKRIFTKNV